MLIITEGPHQGWWIKDGDKVIIWCYSKEHAEIKLKELQ